MSILILYLAIIIAVINGWQYFVERQKIREAQLYSKNTMDWIPVEGQIITSTVTKVASTNVMWLGDMDGNPATPNASYSYDDYGYRIDIEYNYTVEGNTYDGRMEGSGEIISEKLANDRVRRYPAGSPITVYYDPQHPGDAVLSRSDGIAYQSLYDLDKKSLIVKVCIVVIILTVLYRTFA